MAGWLPTCIYNLNNEDEIVPKPLTPRQRFDQAKEFIQKAREVPEPEGLGYRDLAFVAQVKDLLRQARDLVKFLQ